MSSLKLATVAVALIDESFVSNQKMSDEAAKLRLELLAELAEEVGERRFVRAVRDTIKVSHRRWDCSVARIREMAGIRYLPPISPAAAAWEFVTRVFVDHCRTDPDGNYRLEEKITIHDGKAQVMPVPEIPLPVKRAIQCLGGWAALAEAWPEYAGQKFAQFKEVYHGDEASPCVDSRPAAELERVRK